MLANLKKILSIIIPGPALNEQIDAKKIGLSRWILVVPNFLTLLSMILMQRKLLFVGGCS